MSKTSHHRLRLAQNFLRSSRLVRSLLGVSSISTGDIVYEIGPGRGIITAELAQIARGFNRDHSTVLHAIRAVSGRLEVNSEMTVLLERTRGLIQPSSPPSADTAANLHDSSVSPRSASTSATLHPLP